MLKIRRGSPVGCTVTLTGESMYRFIFKLINEVFPKSKDFNYLKFSKNLNSNSFSFSLKDLSNFQELSKQFYFFSKLPPLNIVFLANSKNKVELMYLLKSFKLPFSKT